MYYCQEKFEAINGVIRNRQSEKDRKTMAKKDKRTNIDLQNITQ